MVHTNYNQSDKKAEVDNDKNAVNPDDAGGKRKSYCLLIAIFVILGGIMGFVVANLLINGNFILWREIDSSIETIVNFHVDDRQIFYETEEGNLFKPLLDESDMFDMNGNMHPDVILSECNYTGRAFSFTNLPPEKINSCLYLRLGFEGVKEEIYVIDTDGKVWFWSDFRSGLENFYYPILLPVVGLLAGLVAGFFTIMIWDMYQTMRKKNT